VTTQFLTTRSLSGLASCDPYAFAALRSGRHRLSPHPPLLGRAAAAATGSTQVSACAFVTALPLGEHTGAPLQASGVLHLIGDNRIGGPSRRRCVHASACKAARPRLVEVHGLRGGGAHLRNSHQLIVQGCVCCARRLARAPGCSPAHAQGCSLQTHGPATLRCSAARPRWQPHAGQLQCGPRLRRSHPIASPASTMQCRDTGMRDANALAALSQEGVSGAPPPRT